MARQFYHGSALSSGTVVKFVKPVRKITFSAISARAVLNIGTAKSSDKFTVPANSIVHLDFQSTNCGKGVQNLLVCSGDDFETFYSISVDEYADTSAADDDYFK